MLETVTGMMTRLPRTMLASAVLACFLVMSGVVVNQAAAHSLHHAHHNAATHSHVLCSLMCSTGQAVHAAEPVFDATFNVLHGVSLFLFQPVAAAALMLRLSRGPPVL